MSENQETITIRGAVRVELHDEFGNLKQSHEDHNLIVTIGKTYLATWLAAASQAGEFMTYIGLGTGVTSPAAGNTALEAEFSGGGYSRSDGTLTSSTNTWQNSAVFSPGNGTGAVTEAGLFSASTSGTMFARQVFSAYNKAAGDTLTVTWTVTFS
jgi:hypothetical protein